MVASLTARKRNTGGRTKVKTGCVTCRIRKVKCDESKPSCKKCVTTGRTCDGYESPFRPVGIQAVNNTHAGVIRLDAGLHLARPMSTEITPGDIGLLSRAFSVKTMFDVDLDCSEEAKQILHASMTDPALRHAITSLRALRRELERSGDGPVSIDQQPPGGDYGIQQYSLALSGLASKLSCPSFDELRSALLCCHVFIGIEQVRGNFDAMALHIIRGLGIMREYRARPDFAAANKSAPVPHGQRPLLDVFVVKLFAAPCRFADPSANGCPISPLQQPGESRDLRRIAPNMRTELERIAASTLELLAKVSQVQSVEGTLQLQSEKETLLDSLESWLGDLETRTTNRPPGPELISVSFMRLFHLALKIVLLGVLDSPPDLSATLRAQNDRFQGVANDLADRVRAYRDGRGGSGRIEQSNVR